MNDKDQEMLIADGWFRAVDNHTDYVWLIKNQETPKRFWAIEEKTIDDSGLSGAELRSWLSNQFL